jgi:hypothetical protein
MVLKPKKSYKSLRVSYILYTVCPLHVSVAILRDVHYKERITKIYEPMHKCTILSFKTYGLKYMRLLKYKINIEFL